MKALIYLALAAGLATVLLTYRSCALFEGGRHAPYNGSTLPDLLGRLREQRERGDALDTHSQALLRCMKRKDEAIEALSRGRLTLLQAAAIFREAQNDVPNYPWEVFRFAIPGATDEEKLCWTVIDRVAVFLRKRPGQGKSPLDSLEAEFKLRKERGTLRLQKPRRTDPTFSPNK